MANNLASEELDEIKRRLVTIEVRNARVELDKKWETSWARRLSVAVLTCAVTFLLLSLINDQRALLNTFIAFVGYLLSTLALGRIRIWWQKEKA
jgi:hypothetical protein